LGLFSAPLLLWLLWTSVLSMTGRGVALEPAYLAVSGTLRHALHDGLRMTQQGGLGSGGVTKVRRRRTVHPRRLHGGARLRQLALQLQVAVL
jgi:hypothetical protein